MAPPSPPPPTFLPCLFTRTCIQKNVALWSSAEAPRCCSGSSRACPAMQLRKDAGATMAAAPPEGRSSELLRGPGAQRVCAERCRHVPARAAVGEVGDAGCAPR